MRRESDTLRPGDRAPEFSLHDAYGQPHTLRDLLLGAGTKVPAYDRDRLLLVFDRGTW